MRSYIIRRAFKLAAVCLAVIALIGLAFFAVWPLLFWGPRPPEPERVELVDFVGLHVDEVLENRNSLEGQELTFVVVHEETDAYPVGTIIRQFPSAGCIVSIHFSGDVRVRLYVATE